MSFNRLIKIIFLLLITPHHHFFDLLFPTSTSKNNKYIYTLYICCNNPNQIIEHLFQKHWLLWCFLQVCIVFVKSSVLEVQFQTLGISLRLSIAVAIATAAVIPMNWKHSANYRCHQRGWKRLCTSKGKPLKSTNSNWQCKSNFPNSWSQRGPFNCSLFSSPSLFCPVPNFKCADLRPMGDLDPVPSRWKIQLTCSSSCLRYNPLP